MLTSSDESQSQSQQQCIFCPQVDGEDPSDLFTMMNQALITKHLSHSNNHLILPIDILLKIEDPNSATELEDYIVYKQLQYVDNLEENMKRWYRYEEFDGKIKMLSEYYKFHKDIPHVVERNIEKILAKYYDRKRQFDYKCIKKQLKQEQGLSITSVEDSVTENSQTIQQKSKYSTLLNALNDTNMKNSKKQIQMSDSNLLAQICQQIGKAFPKTKLLDNDIKGSFYENQLNFENYVKNQRLKRMNKGVIKASKIEEHLKRNSKRAYNPKTKDNYLNFQKKPIQMQPQNQNQTIKYRNEQKNKQHRFQKDKEKGKAQKNEDKKRFIYNTNIKIEIQNGFFYPTSNDQQYPSQFNSGPRGYEAYGSGSNIASRKSLIGKISALNQDRYRTPVSKIYQPQQTETSTRYRRRNTSIKRQRLKTRESKQFKDVMYQEQREKERQKQQSLPKRMMSSHNLKKPLAEHIYQPRLRTGTISVSKLKLQNQRTGLKADLQTRGNSIKRGSSAQNLRKRSVTLSHNKVSHEKIMTIPITKYSSSQMKDNTKFKGISIKDLLTKKLKVNNK